MDNILMDYITDKYDDSKKKGYLCRLGIQCHPSRLSYGKKKQYN
ncbi:hypothetical protein [Tissierella sp.]|nr:hypothetical protein [Tissierella sp.]